MSIPTLGPVSFRRPVLTTAVAPTKVSFAETWMFAIDDGAGGVVLSGADGAHELQVVRLANPLDAASYGSLSWTLVATGVADIWHIFAHGLHWISYSSLTADSLSLVVLDTSLTTVVGPVVVTDRGGGGLVAWQSDWVTNDHFLVNVTGTRASPGGKVGVSIWDSGSGETIIVRVTKTGTLGSASTIAPPTCNGSSATRAIEHSTLSWSIVNRMLVPQSLDPSLASALSLHVYDRDWNPPLSTTVLLSDATVNYSMATEVTYGSLDHRLVTYRKISPLSSSSTSDPGQIARTWFSDFLGASGEEILVSTNTAARPHTSWWTSPQDGKRYLLTCWSTQDGPYAQMLMVEEITA